MSNPNQVKNCIKICFTITTVLLLSFNALEVGATFLNENGELSESARMELEFSNQLLPSETRTKIVDLHLQAIRKQFPAMIDIHPRGEWIVGELMVSGNQKPMNECIELVNASEYGPLANTQEIGFSIYLFKFQKPYNPKILGPIIGEMCGGSTEPNGLIGDGNDIKINKLNDNEGQYTFSIGSGDCPSGCINKQFWQYSVKPSGDQLVVKLEKEWNKGEESGAAGDGPKLASFF